MVSDILLTLLLVALNGFFVAAEFALVKVRHSQIDLKAGQGNRAAIISKSLVTNLDAYLSACQLGITLASLALGWIGERVVSSTLLRAFEWAGFTMSETLSHQIAIPLAFVLITVLHIVLGEQAPKSAAIRNPLPTTLFVAIPLRIFYFILRPFIWLLNALSTGLLRLLHIDSPENAEIHTEEELRMLLTESEEGGAIKQSEHELIQNVFEFDDRLVKQIYVPRTKVLALDIDDDLKRNIDLFFEEGYSRVPVYKDSIDNIIGVLHAKDLMKEIRSSKIVDLSSILRPAYYVPISKRVNDLLREFQRQHIQLAVVINEFGGTEGIVTMEDIIEELVGEIQDEYDDEKPLVEKKSETEYLVNASASIIDVNDFLPISIPESSDYETVSGYLNKIYEGIPSLNEKIQKDGYEYTILKRTKNTVELVKFTVLSESDNGFVGE